MALGEAELLVDGGRVHAVVGQPLEGERALRSPRSTAWGSPRGHPQVSKDLGGNAFILDGGDQVHARRTPRTFEYVQAEAAAHKHCPREPALPPGVVGGGEFLTERWARMPLTTTIEGTEPSL